MTTAIELNSTVHENGGSARDAIRVLVVDDEEPLCRMLVRKLKQDYDIRYVTGGADAIRQLDTSAIDIVLTDIFMPEVDGHRVLRHARMLAPPVPVIVMTAYGDVPNAVAAMKGGASDFITKPLDIPSLDAAIRIAHRQANARRDAPVESSGLVGSRDWLEPFNAVLNRIAHSSKSVLLVGETGTGKSMVAQEIAKLSHRTGRFVEINCAAIPDTLLEARLFGTVKGAFTDAQDSPGLLEAADGGTLFLDEIGELDINLQAKLLRVLQERKFSRVGATVEQRANVRFIAATNRNLADAVDKGEFRADLYYRLNVVQVEIPPLRARPNDISPLIERFREESEDPVPPFTDDALRLLERYEWPGNVRELRNLVERISVFADPNTPITSKDLELHVTNNTRDLMVVSAAPTISAGGDRPIGGDRPNGGGGDFTPDLDDGQSLEDAVNAYQRAIIVAALTGNKGNMSKTARELNIRRTTLIERCRKLGITDDDDD